MVEITIKGEALDLSKDFSVSVEDSSPIFNDRGSQSVPATVPVTGRNVRLLGAPFRADAGMSPNDPEMSADVVAGGYIRRGTLNVTEASAETGIMFNIGFDNSTAYVQWRERRLADVAGNKQLTPPDGVLGVGALLRWLHGVYEKCDERESEVAVFTIAVDKQTWNATDGAEVIYWELLNIPEKEGWLDEQTVKRVINSELTDVTVPYGYGVSPFLRVWRVLELVFEDLGLRIEGNPFREDPDLARLVVLNNAADALCRGHIDYKDLMPDCTVEEFMNALWVRFGLVYDVDQTRGQVRLRLLRDILESTGGEISLMQYITGRGKLVYNARQYLKLSAATGLEGAAPSTDRFEDFARGLNTSDVAQGHNVTGWSPVSENPGERDWDGDLRRDLDWDAWNDYDPDRDGWDEEWDRDDWEDPDDDRWDDRDDRDDRDDGEDYDGRDDSPANDQDSPGMLMSVRSSASASVLARETVTGIWFKLDAANWKVRESSTGFFNWDPAPDGLKALELTSVDECVPVEWITTVGTGRTFAAYVPVYLTGGRHYHTYVIESDEAEDGVETPLAFMFAYCLGGRTVGRISPENESGLPLTLHDGSRPRGSLLFQFKDGLFARYWRRYDEILRHGNRSIEVDTRIRRERLPEIVDFTGVRLFDGIRCLVDTASYSLGSARELSVDLTLRTIQTQGVYNIDAEQGIPDVSTSMYHLEWRLRSDKFSRNLDTPAVRSIAVAEFKEASGYEDHGPWGNRHSINSNTLTLVNMERLQPTWRTDPTLPAPYLNGKLQREYLARLYYEVHELIDPTPEGSDDDLSYIGTEVIGTVAVDVCYKVQLQGVKVPD